MFNKFSMVNVIPDKTGWVTSWESKALIKTLNSLNIRNKQSYFSTFQISYLPNKYNAASKKNFHHLLGNKVVFDYFHGDPNISSEFQDIFKALKQKKNNFRKIRVSHSGIEQLLLNEGFEEKVNKIPIGIEMEWFSKQTKEKKIFIRKKYNIPQSSFVIGSFQKDGEGWGKGLTPKFIKGPDIFIETLRILKTKIDSLFILLAGPSRGYVITELEKLQIPYRHVYLNDYRNIGNLFHSLDLYIVCSREEGGPKAILESMASLIPIVTTNVGQAQDLVFNKFNGMVSNTFNPEELAEISLEILNNNNLKTILENGYQTALQNSYTNLIPLWDNFFSDLLHK